ncbi:MAG: DUF305 domain-containing protein [Chloroflexota bacterium]|nr:DUF305 domain-containing protein [Chloroflexota bacterium]
MKIHVFLLLTSVLALIVVACGEESGGHRMPDGSTMGGAMPTETMSSDQQMGGSPEAGVDPDLVFIDAMVVHHQSAVMMAEMALEASERDEIRTLAGEIIEAQETEIEQMGQWRDEWYPDAPESDLSGMMDMAGMDMSDDQMQMIQDAEDFDKMFIDMMIPHHESAIEMAQALQETTERPELRELTGAIVTAQEGEIAQMEQWRTEWYGQ